MSATLTELTPPTARWDLTCLFSDLNDPRIETHWTGVEARVEEYAAKYRGKIQSPDLSADALLLAMTELEDLTQEFVKPIYYGHLRFSVEANNPEVTAFMQEQQERASVNRVKLIFFELELQKVPEAQMATLLADPKLANYKHYIERVRVATPYMLSEAEERILEETANTGVRAWQRLHDELLTNHKFIFNNPETGETEELTESEVLDHIRHPNRTVRIEAGRSLSEGLQQLSHVLTFLFNTLLLDKSIGDRLRNRPYAEHSRHMDNEVEKETVDLVMRLCKEYEPIVARYYNVKKRLLGLPELTHIDRYAPLGEAKKQVSYDEAQKIVLESFGAFSKTAEERGREFFEKGWVDAEPREGKTGGAFCNYITPDTHPVIMMSYLNKLDDVMTLAHELGHGVHGSLSRAQSYFNFDGSLPLAELASIFGEQLVFERIVQEAPQEDQVSLYAQKIEGIFASVFRQAAMFRFEQRSHVKRREDGEMTAEEIGAIWQDELQGMFGTSVKMEAEHQCWWSYVGHFIFAPFYVYAYSFGELLALALYQRAKNEGPSFEAKYIEVLTLGGAKSPYDLMKIVGVDLNDENFWRGGFQVIDSFVAKFEELAG